MAAVQPSMETTTQQGPPANDSNSPARVRLPVTNSIAMHAACQRLMATTRSQDDGGSSAEEKAAIDNWLPINASRNAKWWYSAFHNVTAMVGAGVLGLPYAMSELGWYVHLSIINLASIPSAQIFFAVLTFHRVNQLKV
jgi:hypothetical protein